jgi:alkylation response protein AidB-like acyl-CoA dehydrogenase
MTVTSGLYFGDSGKELTTMDFRFTEEQEGLRRQVIEWLDRTKGHIQGKYSPRFYDDMGKWEQAAREFQKRLFDAGFASRHWPSEYGGQGRPVEEEVIVASTIAERFSEIRHPIGVTMGLVAPTILSCGTEEQKKTYLPKILDGTHIWCQGFSEPNAGSDIVNVATRAVRKEDHYVLNGQKVWTSFAHMADYAVMVVRTDPDVPKHKGLSYLLMDMKAPGVEVRPIVQITGDKEFNEIFTEDVKVPLNMLVGQEGQGWIIAITTLMFERAMGDVTIASMLQRGVRQMFETARQVKRSGRPVMEDPRHRQQLAQAFIETMVLKYHGYRHLSHLVESGMPGPEGSIGKLLWSETGQRNAETYMQILGPYGQVMAGTPWSLTEGRAQHGFLRSKGYTIEAGTSEIQRNIIGERVLGLPKDASRARRG